jgi:hypothetical protein
MLPISQPRRDGMLSPNLFSVLLILTGCAATVQSPESDPKREVERAEMRNCLRNEILAVAPQPVDLETATLAVMTRCHWGEAIERQYVADYPEYRDFIHRLAEQEKRKTTEMVRGQIAVARTRGAGN